MKKKSLDLEKSIAEFLHHSRLITLSRLKSLSLIDEIEIKPFNRAEFPKEVSRWLSVIFVASQAVKIIFKVHYDVDHLSALVKSAYSHSLNELGSNQIKDFSNEFCNLCAGGFKGAFEALGVSSMSSLPMATRGEDHVFFDSKFPGARSVHSDAWILSCKDAEIVCSVSFEIYDENEFRNAIPRLKSNRVFGEVEFL